MLSMRMLVTVECRMIMLCLFYICLFILNTLVLENLTVVLVVGDIVLCGVMG